MSLRFRSRLFSDQGLNFNSLGLILIGFTGILIFLMMRKFQKAQKGRSAAYLIPLLTLVVLTLGTQFDKGIFYNIKLDLTVKNDWQRLCVWVKQNTPPDALFIVPPDLEGYHLYAERILVAEFKSNPWLEKDILEWKERLEALTKTDDLFRLPQKGFALRDYIKERYDSLEAEDVTRLAARYGARYVIFPKPKNLPFSVLYENGRYILFHIEPIVVPT